MDIQPLIQAVVITLIGTAAVHLTMILFGANITKSALFLWAQGLCLSLYAGIGKKQL